MLYKNVPLPFTVPCVQSSENWRAAVDLTSRLLAQCGQGPDRVNNPAPHTPSSLQVSNPVPTMCIHTHCIYIYIYIYIFKKVI